MLLFVDETENEDFFIVCGLLVDSQIDMNLIYSRFKNKAKFINISAQKKSKLFTEFKSTLMDKNYQKLKIAMLSELSSINYSIIYSYHKKTCEHFPQTQKEDIYISLLSQIVENVSCDTNVIFDTFNKHDFEANIISTISSLPIVTSIESCDSQNNPGLQFADNICSALRHHLADTDSNGFYDIIKEKIIEV